MLEDDAVTFEEIKDALVARNMTTSIAASEAYFSYNTNGLMDKPITEGIVKIRRWGRKIGDDVITPAQIHDKHVVATLRSHR